MSAVSDESHLPPFFHYILFQLVLTYRGSMSPSTSLSALPHEVKWAILECLNYDDLRSISLVSRALEDIASRLLFATLKLKTAEGSGAKVSAVAHSAKLRSYVRHFKMYVFSPFPLIHHWPSTFIYTYIRREHLHPGSWR